MAVLTYLDQNALINLGRKALANDQFRAKLNDLIGSGALTVVLSPWHLVETAHHVKTEKAIQLAEFIDSLRPAWLLERYDVRTQEIHEDFFRFARIEVPKKERVTPHSAAWATMFHEADSAKFDIPSAAFVKQWIEHPEQLETLRKTYSGNTDSLRRLRKAVKEGKVTDAIHKQSNQVFLKEHIPQLTPAGIEVPRSVAAEYIERGDIQSIPTMVLEKAISEHEWKASGRDDRNTLIDKFHLIPALAYVDEIVSDDRFFHTIYPVVQKTGYVRANLIKFAEFLKRF